MPNFNPDFRGFCLPLGAFARQRDYAGGRAALNEILGGPKVTLAPAEQADAGSLEAFNAALADIEIRLGREAMNAEDRATLEGDPVQRAAWLAKVQQVTARNAAREAAAAEATKAEADAAAIRERARLSSSGLFAALEAYAK